jgi:hypothetical protein
MADFTYKQYTPEEKKIYTTAVTIIQEGLKNGLSFREACSMADVSDSELKRFVMDDVLKIMIAEKHFGKGLALQQLAVMLKLPLKLLELARLEMLEEVGIASAEAFRSANPDVKLGNA